MAKMTLSFARGPGKHVPAAGLRQSAPGTANSGVACRRKLYAALVDEHEPRLLRVARRLCMGHEDRAQDIVQDALLRGYEAFVGNRFEEGTNARAWLLRILTNGFLNDERNRKRRGNVCLDTLESEGRAGAEAARSPAHERPDAALFAATLNEPLERALAALPEGQRACVLLVYVEELGYAEAALVLGLPIGTVRSRLASARLKLSASLCEQARGEGNG